MNLEELFHKLSENPLEHSTEAVRLLIKIADNILSNPKNEKIRTLQKSNSTLVNKIVPVKGAVDCLKMMGFLESSHHYNLPFDVPLEQIEAVKNAIMMWKDSLQHDESDKIKDDASSKSDKDNRNLSISTLPPNKEEIIKPIVLPPIIKQFTNPFLSRIESHFHSCLSYENKDVQNRAKKVVPLEELEDGAQKRLRTVQEHIKNNKLDSPELSIQDMLILELLQWFKNEFFTWVDSPDCEHCGGKTSFSHMSSDKMEYPYTDRVELHRCDSCRNFTAFPRYNDLNILLETRRGRCGEWANTFTLFCRAMGWEARFVVDEGDHVWTEVYSFAQKRWLHCDPCENICDTPLIYETGWNKQITYIIAYSAEEVQDVTWRYTSNHKQVLNKRKACSEQDLVSALVKLRSIRQKDFTAARREYLTKRLLQELVELMVEKKPKADENQGRTSGSSVWRLARGETSELPHTPYTWCISNDMIIDNKITISYSTAQDKYITTSNGKVIGEMKHWMNGAISVTDIFRKEEKDWKQVYLARKEGTESGEIAWKFNLENSGKTLDTVVLNFDHTIYENGKIRVLLCSDNACVLLPTGEISLITKNFANEKNITVKASLSGGKGDVAWQHTQLFRQKSNANDIGFSVTFIFK